MSLISENLEKIRLQIPDTVRLVAVSKTMPAENIAEVYAAGQRHFGENKVQELAAKYELLPKDIQWHFIGHLQTNKVKYIAPFVQLIESVDSLKLLIEIHRQAVKANRKIKCLLQFHIAEEETKFGLDKEEAIVLIEQMRQHNLDHVLICGVMGMATFTEDVVQVTKEFRYLSSLFFELKSDYFKHDSLFSEISMGMSGDYLIAIKEGSTNVRIGSNIFGLRNVR